MNNTVLALVFRRSQVTCHSLLALSEREHGVVVHALAAHPPPARARPRIKLIVRRRAHVHIQSLREDAKVLAMCCVVVHVGVHAFILRHLARVSNLEMRK